MEGRQGFKKIMQKVTCRFGFHIATNLVGDACLPTYTISRNTQLFENAFVLFSTRKKEP